MTSQYIIDRKLPERANLKFYFPNTSDGKPYFVVTLPFFENPSIKESKKARFQRYSLISRSSNLYSYLGADSRKLNLSFHITLPHILEEHRDINKDVVFSEAQADNPEIEKERFASPVAAPPNPGNPSVKIAEKLFRGLDGLKDSAKQVLLSPWAIRGGIKDSELEYLKHTYGLLQTEVDAAIVALNDNIAAASLALPFGLPFGLPASFAITNLSVDPKTQKISNKKSEKNQSNLTESSIQKLKIIDILIYWINIIRASVVNNAQNPIFGPPIIRLRHGVLYQDVPCICTGYNIDFDEVAGYDLQTLLPRRIKVDMKLEEFRTGNFKTFDQNNVIARDNLAGWEAVLTGPQTMDPGYFPEE